MPKKICNQIGCNTLIQMSERYCPNHKREVNFKRYKDYNKRNNDEFRTFYSKHKWREVRKLVIKINPLCFCGEIATNVDHIQELRQLPLGINDPLAYDLSNLNPLCDHHHRLKTEMVKRGEELPLQYRQGTSYEPKL